MVNSMGFVVTRSSNLLKTLAFLCIILAATATGPQDSLPYCIPCEDKYLQELVDISATCDEAPNTTPSSRVTVIEIHGRPLPCVPCHSKFSGRNLTEICNELLPHLKADTTTDEAVEPAKQCSLYNHEVLFKGSCKRLLDNSSCPDGQWLVLVKETPMCVEQPCSFGQIIYNGSCVDGRDSTVCGKNQILFTYHDGSADCECDEKFATEYETGECHFRQIQGPCVEHWYIEKRIDNQAVCVPNLCMKDAFIYFRGECLQKNYTEFCEPENVHISNDTTVTCTKPLQDVLSGGSLLSCPTGERKTPSGRCRKIFIVRQRSSNFIHPYLKL